MSSVTAKSVQVSIVSTPVDETGPTVTLLSDRSRDGRTRSCIRRGVVGSGDGRRSAKSK